MRNLKLTIEYDGTNYAGWQIQIRKDAKTQRHPPTIQGTIEKVLSKILQEKIKLIGSGRTDAGVHALCQVANFKTNSNITLKKLKIALNGLLPDDIKVSRVEKVSLNFHSRFDAKAKLYRYTILNRTYPSPHFQNLAYFYPYPLNVRLMQEAARLLLGKHNFKSFQASGSPERNPIKTIKKLKITKDKDFIHIEIEADGFLYNMARNIVGTLIEIGRGRLNKESLKKILKASDRKLAGPTAPACGLYLCAVKY